MTHYDTVTKRVGEILYYVWDPIGVVRYPQARDEYDSSVPRIVGLLSERKSRDEIAAHLLWIEDERMGLTVTSQTQEHAAQAAQLLIELYGWLSKER